MAPNGSVYVPIADQVGTTWALLDESGDKVNSYGYDAFGVGRSASETVPNLYRFGTKRVDADPALYHFIARQYRAAVGRFATRDDQPMTEESFGGRRWHTRARTLWAVPYSAFRNRPLRFLDPTGGSPVEILTCAYQALQGLMTAAGVNAATNLFNCDTIAQDCATLGQMNPFQIGSCEGSPRPFGRPSRRRMEKRFELDWDDPSVLDALKDFLTCLAKLPSNPFPAKLYMGLVTAYWCIREGCGDCVVEYNIMLKVTSDGESAFQTVEDLRQCKALGPRGVSPKGTTTSVCCNCPCVDGTATAAWSPSSTRGHQ